MEQMGGSSRNGLGMVARRALVLILLLSACNGSKEITADPDLMLYRIEKSNTNVYLIKNDDGLVMIDTGYEKDTSAILERMEGWDLDVTDIKFIVLTHAHSDHVGGVSFFQKKSGAQVVAGAGDLTSLRAGSQGPLCPTSRLIGWFARSTEDTFTPIEPDVLVDHTLDLSSWSIQMEQLPGHTEGSLIIYSPVGVFVGDLIRGGIVNSCKPTRHFMMCDLEDNDADIRYVLDKTPGKTWYPGHFGPLDMLNFKGLN